MVLTFWIMGAKNVGIESILKTIPCSTEPLATVFTVDTVVIIYMFDRSLSFS